MTRYVSVWLPRWPVQRLLTTQHRTPNAPDPVDPALPLVLASDGAGGPRVICASPAAVEAGVHDGCLVSDARARAGQLQVRPLAAPTDREALRKLALWATRYAPAVTLWGPDNGEDGFFIEVSGSSHLFGGEDGLLDDLARRVAGFGLTSRLALAATPGLAWALSHYDPHPARIAATGTEKQALTPLPPAALRLPAEATDALATLGFDTAGAVMATARAPLSARFSDLLLRRIDQALGVLPEALTPLAPPARYEASRSLLEPITTQDAVLAVTTRLMRDLDAAMNRDGIGARALRLTLYRVDGVVRHMLLALAAPTRSPDHVARMVALNLERHGAGIDAGFGFESLRLAVTATGRLRPGEGTLPGLAGHSAPAIDERRQVLLDSYRQRFGAQAVQQLRPVASHVPEQAQILVPATLRQAEAWPQADRERPALLLTAAEPVQTGDDEPLPRQVRWRGEHHVIAHWQGPERVCGEWWLARSFRGNRDYYVAETAAGRRFWLYRETGAAVKPGHWFMQGLFA